MGQDFKLQLLRSNLLEIQVHRYIDVNIKVVHTETKEVLCSFDIAFKYLLEEIEDNYQKYIKDIQEINSDFLKAKIVRQAVQYHEILMKLLDMKNQNQ